MRAKTLLILFILFLNNCIQINMPPVDEYIAILLSLVSFKKSNSTQQAPTSDSIPPTISYSGSPYVLTLNLPINTITPTITGTITSCSSAPTLPAGLTLNNTTCTLSGTPTTSQASTSYTITASNLYGNTTATISITVNPPRFTVTYIGNGNTGGSVPIDSNSYLQGDTVTVKSNSGILKRTPPAQTAEAFKFGEWNTAANGSGTTYTAGTGTFTMGSSNVTLYARWIPYVLGDTGPAGGLIFYDSGSFHSDGNGNWRYLEAAAVDQGSVSMKTLQTLTSGTGTAIGTGKANTTLLIASGISPAATLCTNHNGGGYTDWFFPSIDELSAIYTNLKLTGLSSFTADVTYWSSSENTASYAWYVPFNTGGQAVWFKTSSSGIRAARAF